jgi:hypothetical protein
MAVIVAQPLSAAALLLMTRLEIDRPLVLHLALLRGESTQLPQFLDERFRLLGLPLHDRTPDTP